jgi:hypothetical protein
VDEAHRVWERAHRADVRAVAPKQRLAQRPRSHAVAHTRAVAFAQACACVAIAPSGTAA